MWELHFCLHGQGVVTSPLAPASLGSHAFGESRDSEAGSRRPGSVSPRGQHGVQGGGRPGGLGLCPGHSGVVPSCSTL